jgi:hypothetical protein
VIRHHGRVPAPGTSARPAAPRRPTAPPILDPILAAWERLYRRRHRIRPIRATGVLGLELRRHRGRPVALADGTIVVPGDLVGVLHLMNERVRELAANGWQTAGWREGRRDLTALAAWARRRPPDERPVAYTATTILRPLAARAGFELHPRPRTWWTRLEDWHFRSLLRRWNPKGAERLRHGHDPLRSAEIWLSAAALETRYGERGRPVGRTSTASTAGPEEELFATGVEWETSDVERGPGRASSSS